MPWFAIRRDLLKKPSDGGGVLCAIYWGCVNSVAAAGGGVNSTACGHIAVAQTSLRRAVTSTLYKPDLLAPTVILEGSSSS